MQVPVVLVGGVRRRCRPGQRTVVQILGQQIQRPALDLDEASLHDFGVVNKPYRLSDLARALRTTV